VNEHIFLGVVPVDEAVARLDVEPLDGSRHFGGNDFLLLLHLLLFLTSLVVFVGWLGLRVSHDGNVVGMVTNLSPRLLSKMAKDLVKS